VVFKAVALVFFGDNFASRAAALVAFGDNIVRVLVCVVSIAAIFFFVLDRELFVVDHSIAIYVDLLENLFPLSLGGFSIAVVVSGFPYFYDGGGRFHWGFPYFYDGGGRFHWGFPYF